MDHQQNYEFPDQNSFGFINSFSGGDNFLMSQPQPDQQQHNGKEHSHPSSLEMSSMQTFEQANPSNPYISQPPSIMYDLPEVIVPQQPISDFPDNVGYLNTNSNQSDINLTSPKESMFNLENPPLEVPANIIQQNQPADVASAPDLNADTPLPVEHQPDTSLPSQPSNKLPEQTSSVSPTTESPSKPSTSVFSPEQNNMMKALGVVRKEVLSKTGSKRRRRILQLNEEESEDESDLKKEMLQESPEKDKEKGKDSTESEDSSPDSESDDPTIANNPEALKARSLLKSAVIIIGPKSKKKKRVLESDDEDEMQTSVDDIGLLGSNDNDNENENDEHLFGEAFDTIDVVENNVLIENPIIPQDDFTVPVPPMKTEQSDDKQSDDVDPSIMEPEVTIKTEKTVVKSEQGEDTSSLIKTEDAEIDPAMSVEAILENIKPMADDDEFFKAAEKSDDSDCQFVSNEDYFGTPDLNKPLPSFTRNRIRSQKSNSKRKINLDPKRRKRSNKYEQDFVEGSSESDDTTYSESSPDSSDSSAERARRKIKLTPKKPMFHGTFQPAALMRVPMKRPVVKKDRFYDKSRDIPNDVYFGDVKVPLHVLHTRWNDDKDDFPEPERSIYSLSTPNRFNYTSPSTNFGRPSFSHKSKPTFSYVEQSDDPKLSTLKDFAKMAGIKLNFARLFDGVRSTEDKCVQIRRVLAQKGLQGEPTVAKCKQLRLDLQAKRESAELDKSVIIRTEGRTRRATRKDTAKSSFSAQPSTSSSVIQPETLQTLSKIRRVVDSDSE